ncbi:acyl-coenzyme A thioesterase 13 isoform X3 [Dendrobium catenatum]|uniref:acyl-coenzyme A thioesterase 13 isoform X3 n=1 Tax=Dendrobium catenatum TaxID=906689 RepID=UPI00109FAD33|nr:acyl-coenzyme A thioesterase 13 isoform X3 [Dendrobium catenatum]
MTPVSTKVSLSEDYVSKPSVQATSPAPSKFLLASPNGNMSLGAIANLVDEVGGAAMHADGHHMKVSVDISISFLANAKLHDELEITSRVLGHRGSYYTGTYVLLRNKTSGEVIAEGRHSLFGNLRSKI